MGLLYPLNAWLDYDVANLEAGASLWALCILESFVNSFAWGCGLVCNKFSVCLQMFLPQLKANAQMEHK